MVLTYKELDDYIESIGGLTHGYTGNKILNSDFFEVSQGWNQLIKDLISDLIKMGWNREVIQVKEKFGTLRFYYSGGNDYIDGMVTMAETMSSVTCEECGNPGSTLGCGWLTTLCEKHAEEKGIYKDDENE